MMPSDVYSRAVGAFPKDPRLVLSRAAVREVYDKHAEKVRDSESSYGGPATSALLRAADFKQANQIIEFGIGSGGLAERLLSAELSDECTYLGVDQSPNMADIATARLKKFGPRVRVLLSDGAPVWLGNNLQPGSFDAFLSTYVVDTLSDDDIAQLIMQAWRLLRDGGQLCLTGLTYGATIKSGVGTAVWNAIYSVAPQVVGGCRPQELQPYLGPGWHVSTREVVEGGWLASEVLVATKQGDVSPH